jgi:hypothetical protein
MLTTPFVLAQPIEDAAADAIRRGDLQTALAQIAAGVEALVARADLAGRSLYLPLLDQYLAEVSDALVAREGAGSLVAGNGCDLVIATETYATGGHTRVIEDLCRHLERPVVLLTDLFGRIGSGALPLDYLHRVAGAAGVIVLPPGPLLGKVVNLLRTVRQLAPRRIAYLTHHQDPIAFAALSGARVQIPSLFIHHADHNPALGATLDRLHHVDLIRELGRTCARALMRATGYLPLHVADRGVRAQPQRSAAQASVVSCGAMQKYARSGPLAYREIVATVCREIGGSFHHIGALPDDWVDEIRAHLASQGLAPGRFNPIGAVTSLWGALLQLDADAYITSAPLGGGRAAIEAQGSAHPIVYYRPTESGRPVLATDVYNASAHGWSNLDELAGALRATLADAPALARASREFYDNGFGSAVFGAAVQRNFEAAQALIG